MRELPNIWLVVGVDKNNELVRAILSASYSSSGLTVTVRRHHSGDIVGRASGGNYDKTSCALGKALEKIYGIPFNDTNIEDHALAHGVKVRTLTNTLWALGVND